MKPKGSIPCPQEFATRFYSTSDYNSLHSLQTSFEISFNITLTYMPKSFKCFLPFTQSDQK
jgi:hypothetical protein